MHDSKVASKIYTNCSEGLSESIYYLLGNEQCLCESLLLKLMENRNVKSSFSCTAHFHQYLLLVQI